MRGSACGTTSRLSRTHEAPGPASSDQAEEEPISEVASATYSKTRASGSCEEASYCELAATTAPDAEPPTQAD
jgi:hypothetical protein